MLPADSTAACTAGISRLQAESWLTLMPATKQASNRQCTDRHDDVAFRVSMTPAEDLSPVSAVHAWHLMQQLRAAVNDKEVSVTFE